MKRLLALYLLLLLLVPMTPTWGKELVVGVSETDYSPFYFEEEGMFKGAAAEIAQNLATALGHTLTFQRFPWKRVQHNLATGRIDMVILYFKTDERAEHALYVEIPHLYESSSLVVTTDSTLQFDGKLNNLKDAQFGNVTGYWHGEAYSANDQLNKTQLNSTRTLLATLIRGKIDIAVGNKPVMLSLARKMKIAGNLRFLEPKIDYAPDYIAFSKAKDHSADLARQFTIALKEFMRGAQYRDILTHYGFEIPAVPAG
ncbi:substrate-binding periplasmic protein [Aestuariispira insulae]|uniref:Amino acid ABC transporter substrate-binding protein (PAAT family) n=1 Tax=Aestuariispira insulae TaxID=1461337 RepID=A0A3D9HWM0_9PROT|nr:transporter substrate-binding domain-containing protein [Aestuariispira insulae]RED53902.1 amino acid ABC transporter substrate-binding protein (PAAT family) [Aestuariispira insulae]